MLIKDEKIIRVKKTGHGIDVFIDSEKVRVALKMKGIREELGKKPFMMERFGKYL